MTKTAANMTLASQGAGLNIAPEPTRLAWAVLTKSSHTGVSEVIKVTGHEEADQTVKDNPGVYYKSGPFLLA